MVEAYTKFTRVSGGAVSNVTPCFYAKNFKNFKESEKRGYRPQIFSFCAQDNAIVCIEMKTWESTHHYLHCYDGIKRLYRGYPWMSQN